MSTINELPTTIQIDNVSAFQHLSNFSTLKDFNNNMEQILLDYKKEFTKSQLVALKQLLRFCAKVKGVATARICKIVSATWNKTVGISTRTFQRTIKKAEELGILTVLKGERKNGSQTSNIYVFNRYETVKEYAEQQASQVVEIVSESNTIDVPEQRKLSSLKAFNLLKHLFFKQEKDILKLSAINDEKEGTEKPKEQTPITREMLVNTYNVNEWQLKFYDNVISFPYSEKIHDVAGLLSLILEKDCDSKRMRKAIQVVNDIALNMVDGVHIEKIQAVFRSEMNLKEKRYNVAPVSAEEPTENKPSFNPIDAVKSFIYTGSIPDNL